jgi:predicted nucleic acid-binding protein
MIVLDTEVLSELMKPAPSPEVVRWVDAQEPRDVAVTAVTMAEILHGVARLPEGKRKAALLELAADLFSEEFAERVLPFDESAATYYADLVVTRERAGRPVSMAGAQIAAICLSHEALLATRNTRDFEGVAIPLVNPWEAPEEG